MTGRKGFSREAEPKERGLQGSTFQTGRHRPFPNIPVPLGIPLGARTGAREYFLDLWRERWEAGAAGEATLPPPSTGDIPGNELGPKGCGSVLGKTPARIPLHTNFPKVDIPAGQARATPPGTSNSEPWELHRSPGWEAGKWNPKKKPTSRLVPVLQGFSRIKR